MGNIPVTGAVDNGAGKVRLTVASTEAFVTGQMVMVGGIGGVLDRGFVTNIVVIDGTHMDLTTVLFSGAYTSGGWVAALPRILCLRSDAPKGPRYRRVMTRARSSSSHLTLCWRRQSRANPSQLKFPVSRENTGNFIGFGLGHPNL